MPYLQMTKEEFEDFRDALWKFAKIKSVEDQKESADLSKVIRGIEIIKEVLTSRIVHFLENVKPEDISSEIEGFTKAVCPPDAPEFWKKIQSSSVEWFYLKKAFQLSHLHGIYSRKLEDFAELRDYSYLQLYTDYYESFAKRLKSILSAFGEPSNTLLNKRTAEFYIKMCKDYELKLLTSMEIKAFHNEIRKSINHGSLITYQDRLEYIPLAPESAIETELRIEYVPKIRALITYSVLFSTELDLLLFRKFKDDRKLNEKIWQEYFELYFSSWKRHKELFG
jgi:hypothetical protein